MDKSLDPDSLEGVADRRGLVTHPGLYGATAVMPTTSLSAESTISSQRVQLSSCFEEINDNKKTNQMKLPTLLIIVLTALATLPKVWLF